MAVGRSLFHSYSMKAYLILTILAEAEFFLLSCKARSINLATTQETERSSSFAQASNSFFHSEGTGVGRQFHVPPEIPHYGKRGKGLKLRPGMVFTVEPMLNQGTRNIKFLRDRWTVITQDRKLSAQFEHTVAVTKTGVEILTLAKAKRRI